MSGKRWEVLHELKIKNGKLIIENIIQILLENRNIKTKKEKEEFLHPKLQDVTVENVGIDIKQLTKTVKRIQKAIDDQEQIVIFGDYDVDGITGTAILWETLHKLGANVLPYIPHRVDEGYGLSQPGIKNLEQKIKDIKLIITVDNGIVANEAVDFANVQGIDVIITDHHTPPAGGGEKLPDAYSIVHTTKLCGAGVAYLLSQNIKYQISNIKKNEKYSSNEDFKHLDLVALATVADLVPLTGANRTLLKNGLEYLRSTKRLGLQELFQEAQIDPEKIGVYEIGHMIAPRINAMGRIASAMDSLRLLCTTNPARAKMLAQSLSTTNRERQLLTQASAMHAIEKFKTSSSAKATAGQAKLKNLLFIAEETYEEGIIGLVAGKLVEEFYRPSIVISKGEKVSKASARSVSGFNIIEFIRSASEFLINAGGHPMAAGFTIETEKIVHLQKALEKLAEEQLHDGLLTRIVKIDCELPVSAILQQLYDEIQQLAPFGMGNPEPTFVSKGVFVEEIRAIGREKKHLKLMLTDSEKKILIEGIAFGMGELEKDIKSGDTIDIVYTIDENEWQGRKKLQVKVRDIKLGINK